MTSTRNKGNSIIAFPNEYVVLDLETTGLDPKWDEIIEIGAVKYSNGTIVDSYVSLVKPSYSSIVELDENDNPDDYSYENGQYIEYISQFITSLTGITNSMLSNAPSQHEAVAALIEFVGDSVIIGHNINFDINFVYDAYYENCGKEFNNDFIDTMRIARKLLKQLDHHRLCDVCKYYKIDYSSAHRAETDCKLTNDCFVLLKRDAIEKYSSLESFCDQFTKKGGYGSKKKLSVKDIKPEEGFEDEDSPIFGKEVVITGTLERMPRKDALQLVANIGGVPSNNVGRHTNFLVIANKEYDQITEKKKKARELILKGQDLQIVSEDVFYSMLGLDEMVEQTAPTIGGMVKCAVEKMLDQEYEKSFEVSELTQKNEVIGYSYSIMNRVVFRIKTSLRDAYRVELFNYQDNSKDLKEIISTSYPIKETEDRLLTIDIEKDDEVLLQLITNNKTAIKEKMFDIFINFSSIESFGCCHRYIECSNMKRCLMADIDQLRARGCMYRKNLEDGRIFYGINANV